MKSYSQRNRYLVKLAMLIAIEILLAFTPLGYLRVGIVEITFMTVPVAIGAMILDPAASLILGAVFGISSFLQCFGISAFGTVLFSVNPVGAVILCILPRLLMGILTGLVFRLLRKRKKDTILSFVTASFCAALFNTLFFVLTFIIFFRTATLPIAGTEYRIADMNLFDIFVFIAGINGIIELAVCTLLSTGHGKALSKMLKR